MSDTDRDIFENRIRKIQLLLSHSSCDAFLAICQDNSGWQDIYYLCGFTGSSGVLLVTSSDTVLFVDSRYAKAAGDAFCRSVCCSEVNRNSPLQAAVSHLNQPNRSGTNIKRVALLSRKISHITHRYIEESLGERAELKDISKVLSKMRRRKEPHEISCIKKAVDIAKKSFLSTLELFYTGMTEREFAANLGYLIQKNGADFNDSPPIMVATGDRSAMPNSYPSDRRIERGDIVLVDFCVRYSGYICDITRMLSIGRPADEIKTLHSLLLWAQAEALSMLRPGVPAATVDAAARAVLESAGLGKFFVHGIGHGIGLDIHEQPSLFSTSNSILEENDVITLEPGFYKPNWCGMRTEDDYLITRTGGLSLTEDLSSELFVL